MSALGVVIAAEIARLGPLPFARFMELALYEPTFGYYSAGKASIGRGGDFLTSVSVGPLFGRLLSAQFKEMWTNLGCPAEFTLVEQGANNGDFVHDVLVAAAAQPEFLKALQVQIVEPFAINQARQRQRLSAFAGKVAWVKALEDLPSFVGVHFSNELLDAMPVHWLVRRNGGWREKYVHVIDEDKGGVEVDAEPRFEFLEGELSTPELQAILPHLPEVEGYEAEVNLAALHWVRTLAARLKRGYVLVADYGFCRADFFHPDRTRGTLLCYRQHQKSENPLQHIGEQDITAHVEFTSISEKAEQAGLQVVGFADQHHFLVGLAKRVFTDASAPLSAAQQSEMRKLTTLMHPAMMGRGFQFLALAKQAPASLGGFEFGKDAREALWP